jgi:predicted ATPase/DNA-binding CsgD family transcriptional regulator
MAAMQAVRSAQPYPLPRTRLIGRRAELATGRALLLAEAAPLLTLTGPGGCGKTRLAIAIADEVAGQFADGVAWVDLAPLADPALVPDMMALALGLVPTPGAAIPDEVARWLRSRQTLLLLDNCEHLLPAVAELVAYLLGACPAVQVLATSRAPLRVRGEHELTVHPLPLPPASSPLEQLRENEAVCLFVERARAVSHGFTLDGTNALAVSEVCRRLDGLPLAIELAAARVKILSPDALLAHMSDRLRLLTGGPRDAPSRHQTIRDAIAWSYDLLPEREQALFPRLAVFVGGFTLEGVEGVAEPCRAVEQSSSRAEALPPDHPMTRSPSSGTLELLTALVDQSLVRRVESSGEPRLTMLESIREFAWERLTASGEDVALRDRHATFFLTLAEEAAPRLRGAEQAAWLDRLEADHTNLRAALEWFLQTNALAPALRLAGALGLFWRWHCHFIEGRQWLARLLAAANESGSVPPAVRARAHAAAGMLAWAQGDFAEAAAHHGASRKLSVEAGDAWGVAFSLYNLANQIKMQGDLDRPAQLYEASLAGFEAIGDVWGVATLRHALGLLALDSGDLARAEPMFAENLERARSVGDRWLLAATLVGLARIAARHNDRERAEPLLEEALALFRAIGERRWIAHTRSLQGLLASWRGDRLAALRAYREALAIARELGVRFYIAEILERLAALLVASDIAEDAARFLGAAAALRATLASPPLPLDLVNVQHATAGARAALGEAAWSAAFAEGQARPLDRTLSAATAIMSALESDLTRPSSVAALIHALPTAGEESDLTGREREVLSLLAQRMTDLEIAERLYISRRTASHHVGSIIAKVGAANRREVVALAIRQGWV